MKFRCEGFRRDPIAGCELMRGRLIFTDGFHVVEKPLNVPYGSDPVVCLAKKMLRAAREAEADLAFHRFGAAWQQHVDRPPVREIYKDCDDED